MYSPRLTTLVFKFLEKSPTNRPKIADILEVFPSKLRKAKFRGPQLESASSNEKKEEIPEKKEEVNEKMEDSLRVESETEKVPKYPNSKPQTGHDQIRVIRPIEPRPIKEVSSSEQRRNELEEAYGKRNVVEPTAKITLSSKIEELKSVQEKLDDQEKAKSSVKVQARALGEEPSASVITRNRENEIKQSSNDKQQLATKSTELNQSLRLAKQTSTAKKTQEKINEAETTAEAKPRLINNTHNKNDLQGNESTLSAKKSEFLNAQNLSSKEEGLQKKSIRDKKTEQVIPEEAHDQAAEQPADSARKKGNEILFSKKLQQPAVNEKVEEAGLKGSNNVNEQKNKLAKKTDIKRVMMNPIINSSSPRMSLANTKFSRIISLRNETNFNIMRGNFSKRDPSTGDLQADFRPRPVSAQVGKRPQWDGNKLGGMDKGYLAGKQDSLLGADSYENDIYDDKDEKEVYELLEQFGQNRGGAFNRPKSAMVYSKATAMKKEEAIKNINDYAPDNQPNNIRLRDLLSHNASPRSFQAELRALDHSKQRPASTKIQGVEPKYTVSQANQDKLLSKNQYPFNQSDTSRIPNNTSTSSQNKEKGKDFNPMYLKA